MNYIEVFSAVKLPGGQFLAELYTEETRPNNVSEPMTFPCGAAILSASHGELSFSHGNAGAYASVDAEEGANVTMTFAPEIARKRAERHGRRYIGPWLIAGARNKPGHYARLQADKNHAEVKAAWLELANKSAKRKLQHLREYRAGGCSVRYLAGRNVVVVVEGNNKAIAQARDFHKVCKMIAESFRLWKQVLPCGSALEKLLVMC